MKREHWFLVAGLAMGLVLGGVRCSISVKQQPAPSATGKPALQVEFGEAERCAGRRL